MPAITVNRISLSLLVALSIPVGLYAFLFQFQEIGDPSVHERFAQLPTFALFHVLGAGVALLIGGFQFSSTLRNRYPHIHRWVGRIYLTAVMLGGIGGVATATQAGGGLVAQFGFALLGLVWLYSAAQAYLAIRSKRIAEHRVWMMRNFALTFAAVTLRLYLPLLGAAGFEFEQSYPVVAWIAWVPNLIFVEWFLLRRTP